MILRRVGEHFYEVIVQSVVELALQMPGKLRMVEIASVNGKHVGVNGDGGILQVDQNFYGAIVFADGEGEQRMLVEPQVLADFFDRVGSRHRFIVLSFGSRKARRGENRVPKTCGKPVIMRSREPRRPRRERDA